MITIAEEFHEQYMERLEVTEEHRKEIEWAQYIYIVDDDGESVAIPKSLWPEFIRHCQKLQVSS
jgi:hypothetical protein